MTSSFVKAPPTDDGPAVIRPQDSVLMTTIVEEQDEANRSRINTEDDDEQNSALEDDDDASINPTGGISVNNAFLVDDRTRRPSSPIQAQQLYDVENNTIEVASPPRHFRQFRLFSTSTTADADRSSGNFYDEHIVIDDDNLHDGIARYRHLVVGLSVLAVICATSALIVSLMVVDDETADATDAALASAQEQNSEPSQPSTFVSENHLFQHLRRVLQEFSDPFSFLSPDTPQSRGLTWLVMEGGQDPTLNLWNEDEMIMPRLVQRYALIVFALACGGDAWRGVRPSWMQVNMEHECDWRQVTCNDQEQVIGLSLDAIDVSCSLPEEISILTHLQFFHASQNDVKGTLPSSISTLTDLREFRLTLNKLSSSIPTEIGLLTNLEKIELAFNGFTGTLPQELEQLSNLRTLDILSNPHVEGPIFNFLPSWPNLRHLVAGYTRLEGTLPIVDLQNITELDVRGMKDLSTIPDSIGTLTNLEVLRFENSHFNSEKYTISGTIPTQMGQLTKLDVFSIFQTDIHGPIPSELGRLEQAFLLSLNSNHLTGTVPSELGNLINVGIMSLADNKLSGTIPTELGALTRLTGLYLEGNQRGIVVPTEVCSNRNIKISYTCSYICQCCREGCYIS